MPACPLAWPLVLSKRWKPHLFSLKEFCFGKLMILGRLAEAGSETSGLWILATILFCSKAVRKEEAPLEKITFSGSRRKCQVKRES